MRSGKAFLYSAIAFVLIVLFAGFYSAAGFTAILSGFFSLEGLFAAFLFIFANILQVSDAEVAK